MRDGRYIGISSFRDKFGRTRYRFRRVGLPTAMLYAEPGTAEFEDQYALAAGGRGHEIPRPAPVKQSDRFPFRSSTRQGFVYFICADRGPVKIGFSTDPTTRLKGIATYQARKMRILATLPGTMATESMVQARWHHLRIRGEWFRRSADLMKYIRDIADGKVSEIVFHQEG
jgi:Meiotically up-regulated gene 113